MHESARQSQQKLYFVENISTQYLTLPSKTPKKSSSPATMMSVVV